MNVPAAVTRERALIGVDRDGRVAEREAVCVECHRCGQTFCGPVGRSGDERVVARLLVLLRQSCPRREGNFYHRDDVRSAIPEVTYAGLSDQPVREGRGEAPVRRE